MISPALRVRQEEVQQAFEWARPRFALAIPIWDLRDLWRGRPDVLRSAYLACRLERLPLDPRWDPFIERVSAADGDPAAAVAILIMAVGYIMRLATPGLCVHIDEPISLTAIRAAWHLPETPGAAEAWDRAIDCAYAAGWLTRIGLDNRTAVEEYKTDAVHIAYARVRKLDKPDSVCGQRNKALAYSATSERSAAKVAASGAADSKRASEAAASGGAAVSEAEKSEAADGERVESGGRAWMRASGSMRELEDPQVRRQAIRALAQMSPKMATGRSDLVAIGHEALCLQLADWRGRRGLKPYPASDEDRSDLLVAVRASISEGKIEALLDWLRGASGRLTHGGGFRVAMRAEGYLPEGTRWR